MISAVRSGASGSVRVVVGSRSERAGLRREAAWLVAVRYAPATSLFLAIVLAAPALYRHLWLGVG